MKNRKVLLILSLAAVALLLAALPAPAQVPGPHITAWPLSLIFCKPPLIPPGPEAGAIGVPGGSILSNALRLITISNQGTGPLILEDIHLTTTGIVGSTARVHGIARSGLPIEPDVVIMERKNSAHSMETLSGWSAVTDCFDIGANALVMPPGGSCTVFLAAHELTHTAQQSQGRSVYIEIASNDPGRPVLSVPVVVSHSPNCRPSAGVHDNGTLGDITGFTPFTDVLPGEEPPQAITPTADCNCGVSCRKSDSHTGGHVTCFTADRCFTCCRSFGDWYCGDDGIGNLTWSNFF